MSDCTSANGHTIEPLPTMPSDRAWCPRCEHVFTIEELVQAYRLNTALKRAFEHAALCLFDVMKQEGLMGDEATEQVERDFDTLLEASQ